jgi:ABC-2 type transport system permease protein
MIAVALATEAGKLLRSRVMITTGVMLTLGIALLCSSMLLAAGGADPQLRAKLGALADPGGWVGYLTTSAQISSIAGLLGFGVALSWLYGREFADGTITGLFALPVGRGTIATAKFAVYLAWAAVVAVALAAVLLALGFAFGLGAWPAEAWPAFGRQIGATALTALVAAPAGWASTLGRGLLPGIGTVIGIVVVAQVTAVAGVGAWVPLAAPGLWAASAGTAVTAAQLALVVPLAAGALGLTVLSWRRLQLDR